MGNPIDDLITGIGALSELCGLFRVELMKNGFSKEESLVLIGKLIEGVCNTNRKGDDQ